MMPVEPYREIAAQTGSSLGDSKLFSSDATPSGLFLTASGSMGTFKATAVTSS
jgi:hypothetical protein